MTFSLALATLELWLGLTLLTLADALLLKVAASHRVFVRAVAAVASRNLLLVMSLRVCGLGLSAWALMAWLSAGIFAAGDGSTFNWIGYRFLYDWRARGAALVVD